MDNDNVIIGAGLVVVLTATIGAITESKNPWPLVGAGIGSIALLSLLAAAGTGPAKIASGLAVVVAMTAVMYEAIPLFGFFGGLGGTKPGYESGPTRENKQ